MVNTHVGEAKGTKIIKIRLVERPSLMMIKAESYDESRLFSSTVGATGQALEQ